MKRHDVQQHTERRIAAALRLLLAAFLLFAQIGLVIVLSLVLRQRFAIVYTVLELVALCAAIRINSRPGGSNYRAGWIILVVAVPVVGLILYVLWSGEHQNKQLSLKNLPMPAETEARQETSRLNVEKLRRAHPQWGRIASYLNGRGFPLYQHTRVDYLSSGEEYLDDMLEEMEYAEHFIFMEYFIMATGRIWDRLVDILSRKAAQGVEIKLIFDDFGSMMRIRGENVEKLRRMGVEVKIFNPVHHYVNRLYFNYRDHRKITCVDGNVSYTGGVNVGDEYANITHKLGHWKDCGIRLEGEGAWGLTRDFIHMWEQLGGHMEQEHDYYRPHGRFETPGFCQSVSDGPNNNPESTMEDIYLQLINGANRMVYVTTPYLTIDDPMTKALCLAGDSGLDVRLVMPGIPDKKYAYLVAEGYFGELLSHGVRIFTYTPGFLHSKMILSDREAAFVGSVNVDFRSFRLHFECGTVLFDDPALEEILEDLYQIIDLSSEVTITSWKKRPWYRKVLSTILRMFAIWM